MDKRTIRYDDRPRSCIVLLWLGFACHATTAQTVVYDQTSNPTGGLYLNPGTGEELDTGRLPILLNQTQHSVVRLGDVGQSFRAGASYMDVFELFTFTGNPLPTTIETFVAHIRLGGPQGPVLATSDEVTFREYPRQFVADVRGFHFSGGLSLTPGETYYCGFERTYEQDTRDSTLRSVTAVKQISPYGVPPAYRDVYRGGDLYLDGVLVVDGKLRDLWFRTGYIVPEPGTWALLTLGMGALGWRWRVRGR